MRQKVVWFILGVLVGGLFVVSTYLSNGNIQYVAPAVQKIPGNNYTTLLLYSPNGLPLNVKNVQKAVQQFVVKNAPKAKWHAYAVPELPSDAVLSGYGIKVTKDGRVNVLILATRKGAFIQPTEVQNELMEWSKTAPKFMPDVIPWEKIGVPEGWKAKSVDSNGNVRAYTGESSPYWHNFGRQELRYDDPPYGKLYAQFYIWGLWNDGNPTEERFLCTTDENGHGTYRVTPGVEIGGNYGNYFTNDIKITHDWGVDPTLNGRLGIMKPVGIINKHETLTITIGPVLYPLAIGGYKVYGDAIDPQEVWDFDIPYNEDASHHTIGFMPSSEGVVKESVLHDGSWHSVINVKLWAKFRHKTIIGIIDSHEIWAAVTWIVKVG
ncbi:hypothetical protein [Thermococcus piezophilus]|uniref:Uncharacterized protein n=1 Tax=Thermococcus piezophilus TaxID=1712654 RepID=A0A172WEH1_9EURY|nr:hypothetical protein [Thermococcus piezophilus]ANF21824.1 hypothetical protein A7C91_00345 [Thermococcus piezophilus]